MSQARAGGLGKGTNGDHGGQRPSQLIEGAGSFKVSEIGLDKASNKSVCFRRILVEWDVFLKLCKARSQLPNELSFEGSASEPEKLIFRLKK